MIYNSLYRKHEAEKLYIKTKQMTNAGIEPATFCAHTCLCKTDAITTRPIGPFDNKLLRLFALISMQLGCGSSGKVVTTLDRQQIYLR